MAGRNKNTADPEVFLKVLKDKGLKATPQRMAVHRAMCELGHASAEQVGEYVRNRLGIRISPASVYNILSQFALNGIYSFRLSADNKMYFDVNAFRHTHLYDWVNHTYRDIPDDGLAELVENHFKGRRFKGYRLDGIEIQLMCHPTRKSKS